eukprot:CAMPEP_0168360218 /NCGR_PEP_ID=MMETSP0228-20121227/2047_1 /TAXON_ID=133427 /ORGANISM="Protoceratium reticulatum, Strain CCCM 535 (=CCMP 1889)" /LENGTH=67 /DNA_ID=CAMNT_0008372877 /DNA_START=36 /DNA_END=236 /DNA_ORIENTATION=-
MTANEQRAVALQRAGTAKAQGALPPFRLCTTAVHAEIGQAWPGCDEAQAVQNALLAGAGCAHPAVCT